MPIIHKGQSQYKKQEGLKKRNRVSMNKIIIAISIALSIVASTAQAQTNIDSSKHLTFKGVPINGTLEEYVAKMKNSGFTHKVTKDGVAVLEGDFASYKKCMVGVATLKQKNLVNKIVVLFRDCDDWPSLSSNYFNLKELLTEKYGKPSDCVERFQSSEPDDDGSRITEVQLGSCEYYTIYKTAKGSIQLSIEHEGVTRCYVKLMYFDKINSEVIKKEALNDL